MPESPHNEINAQPAERSSSAPRRPIIRLVSIRKRYGRISALDRVSLEIEAGSVHALVGPNGAGKSTVCRIIGGIVRPDDGEMFAAGRVVSYAAPHAARRDGIAMITQELALVPQMTVVENLFLGTEPHRFGLVSRRRMHESYAELIARSGFELERDAAVGSLSTADRQKVEILRAISSDARVVVMDEPASSLTFVERRGLHAILRWLREQGRAIVYVSHFLGEVLEFCDTVTVMRDGQVVRTASATHETEASLVAGMFGSTAADQGVEEHRRSAGPVRLEVCGLRRRGVLNDVALTVRAGEIVGLAGLIGSGRTELARAIAGADPIDAGVIRVDGVETRSGSSVDAVRAGIGFLTEDRTNEGLFSELTLAANITFVDVPSVSVHGILRRGLERRKTRELLEALAVDPPLPEARVRSLSGGNQQKVLFARWLFARRRVLILDEPTRGADLKARVVIHRFINELADAGAAVLLISSDIEEVILLATRVLVIRQGAIIKQLAADPPLTEVTAAVFGLPGGNG